ncbi:MAG: hypothetical protein KatS3mg130_0958 [Candidatus Sumerlaea sp.]|nr:MAG: hypothetical protein KatS3mg130_0958 [Candidatus Sumerlaea sp.]
MYDSLSMYPQALNNSSLGSKRWGIALALALIFSVFLAVGFAHHLSHSSCDANTCLFQVALRVLVCSDVVEISPIQWGYAIWGVISFSVVVQAFSPFITTPRTRAPPFPQPMFS